MSSFLDENFHGGFREKRKIKRKGRWEVNKHGNSCWYELLSKSSTWWINFCHDFLFSPWKFQLKHNKSIMSNVVFLLFLPILFPGKFLFQVANWRMEKLEVDSKSGSEEEFFDCLGEFFLSFSAGTNLGVGFILHTFTTTSNWSNLFRNILHEMNFQRDFCNFHYIVQLQRTWF